MQELCKSFLSFEDFMHIKIETAKMENKMNKLLTLDSRNRITLPDKCHVRPGDILTISILDTGQIMLTPVQLVPKRLIQKGKFVDTGEEVNIILKDSHGQ